MTPSIDGAAAQQRVPSGVVLGPFIEIDLWRGFSAALDVQFRRPEFDVQQSGAHIAFWRAEVPLTFVYRFRGRLTPILRTGIAFNRVFDISGATACGRGGFGEQFYCVNGTPVAELRHRGTSGFLAGGGIGWKWRRVRFEPELRLTHWFDRNFGVRDSSVRSNLSELGLLIGVAF